jgi:hypothetical protein
VFLFEKGNTGRIERDRCSFRSVCVHIRNKEHHHYRYRNDSLTFLDFKPIDCRKCGNLVWDGVSASSRCPVKLDVKPLDIVGEIVKLSTGIHTYQIHKSIASFRATMRTAHTMKAKDPIVLGTHRCFTLTVFAEQPPDYWPQPTKPTKYDEVPF